MDNGKYQGEYQGGRNASIPPSITGKSPIFLANCLELCTKHVLPFHNRQRLFQKIVNLHR